MDGAEEGAMDLKDEQWTVLEPLIPRPKVRADGRGRSWRDDRVQEQGRGRLARTQLVSIVQMACPCIRV